MTASAPQPSPTTVLRGQAGEVQALAFLNQNFLFSGDSDGCVVLWDLATRRPCQQDRLQSAQAGVLSLQVTSTPQGTPALLCSGRDGCSTLYPVAEVGVDVRNPYISVGTGAYGFCRPRVSRASKEPSHGSAPTAAQHTSWLLACAGSTPGEVQLWDVRQPAASKPHALLPPPPLSQAQSATSGLARTVGQTTAMCFMTPCGESTADSSVSSSHRILVGYESGSLALWETRNTRKPVTLIDRAHTEPVLCIDASPSGQQAVSGSADSDVCVWSVRGDQGAPAELAPAARHTLPSAGVSDVAWRGDGRVLACGGWDGKVRVYSGKGAHKPLAILRHHGKDVPAVAWAPGPAPQHDTQGEPVSAGALATGSRDGTIALWELYNWEETVGCSV